MALKRTILVVDDQLVNRKLLCKILEADYHTIEAENGLEALRILRRQEPSAILLDIMMPEMDGYRFLELRREDARAANIPVIVTTEKEGEDEELKALSLGAWDFLSKPYKPAIILHRLANAIRLRETAAMINRVEKDSLTGLLNREFFYRRAAEQLAAEPRRAFDLVGVDLERFKLVNDLFGMAEGDKLLCYLARLIEKELGGDGICCRLGADVFVVLVGREKTLDEESSRRFTQELQKYPLNIHLTPKYGVYQICNHALSLPAMCDRLRLAIHSIKGKYEVNFARYDRSMHTQLLDEQLILDGMRAGLEKKEFQIYYQPQYELTSGKIVGAEALVRWLHPQKGFLAPDSFLPLFEKNGFITELDCYVWDETCAKIRAWMDLGREPIPTSVNVSRVDLYNPRLPEILLEIVQRHGLLPCHLQLEITETAYTRDPAQLIELATRLRELGFVLQMDDFGTGNSSLSMLSELPLDVLKLDMSFLKHKRSGHSAILRFIIELAKTLGLSVVAEGVETAQQAELLREMGCNFAQGYYYAKPLPQAEFEALLLREL